MKKINKIFRGFFALLVALAFSSCDHSINPEKNASNENTLGKAQVYISLVDPYSSQDARTALPSITWSNYTYTLTGIEGYGTSSAKDQATIFSAKEYSALSDAVTLTQSNYKLTLTAYSSSTPVLSGSAEADFTDGGKSVTFRMYPVSGSSGSAEVSLTIPSDGMIKSVKYAVSSNPVAAASSLTLSDLTFSSTQAKASFTELESGISHFALFYFYDEQGQLLLSYTEGLVIVSGITSTSSVTITSADYHSYACAVTLNKDDSAWNDSGKTLCLKDSSDSSKVYSLSDSDSDGIYTGNVTEGTYYIYDGTDNTNVEFKSVNKTASLNYYTVTFEEGKGTSLTAVTECDTSVDGSYILLADSDFTYKAELKAGYEASSSFALSINGTEVENAASSLGSELTVKGISKATTISLSGASAIVYSITYNLTSDSKTGSWTSGYTAPSSYTVEADCALPTLLNFRTSDGGVLDGWICDGETTAISSITAGSRTGNITLSPKWKDSASADTSSKTIYANGISLIILSENNETHVYVDFDADGEIDAGTDDQVVAANGTKDFTGYALKAGNKNNDPIASDFTFTMKGGTIASITGMGANATNKSVLNISGTSKIGSVTTDSDGNITAVGVDLPSITNEWVIVNGEMSGDYSVVLITQYEYEANVDHFIGYIGQASWANFAHFTCYKKNADDDYYTKSSITMNDVEEDGVNKIKIRLANPAPIAMPSQEGSDAIKGTIDGGFTLGDDRISVGCSVFSVSAENGSFTLKQTELEGGTEYLAQPDESTYVTEVDTSTSYIYLHVMSSTNEITAANASEFLNNLVFTRTSTDKPITIKINLETVPYSEISAMVKEATSNTGNSKAFSYYNGSFYLGVSSSGIYWTKAYNAAKQKTFNGLKGYLMNMTSAVENNYIAKRMSLGNSWIGGARIEVGTVLGNTYNSDITTYDADSVPEALATRTYVTKYIWQAGPEAGTCFTDGTIASGKAGNNAYSNRVTYGYTNWDSGSNYTEPNDSWSGKSEQCVHYYSDSQKWNDFGYNNTDVEGYIVEFTPYETQYGTQVASYQSVSNSASYE